MNRIIDRVFDVMLTLALVFMLSGCANTANGFGGFVEGIGQDVQDMAQSQLD